jgi:hypothetical protein
MDEWKFGCVPVPCVARSRVFSHKISTNIGGKLIKKKKKEKEKRRKEEKKKRRKEEKKKRKKVSSHSGYTRNGR